MCFRSKLLVFVITILVACDDGQEPSVDCAEVDLTLKVTKVVYAECGLSNGQITVEASGGTEPYRYSIDNGKSQASPLLENVAPGFLEITVVDKNGCSATVKTFMTNEDPFPVAIYTTASGCGTSNGSIEVIPLGGVAPFKFQLGENNDDYQATGLWSNLRAERYSVWVEDANKCFFGVYMTVPSGTKYSTSVAPIIETKCATASCHGGSVAPDFRTFDVVKANATLIRSLVENKSMPPDGSLGANEIDLIKCWVDDGALNN